MGHEVTVAIDRLRTEAPSEEIAGPRLRTLGLLDESGLELSVKSTPAAMWRDTRRLAARQLDVVHCHFSHDHFIARWGRPRGARLVRSIHAPRSIRWSLPAADAYTVPTSNEALRLPGRCVAVLPALVADSFKPPVDRAALRRELATDGHPLVGMISTFQVSRHHDVGVIAFSHVLRGAPDARLVLVGDGEQMTRTRELVDKAGVSHAVTFTGYQSGDAFVRWLQALDVVWILGLGNDWSARAAAQARACGVAVIAVDEGALPSLADIVVGLAPEEIARATMSAAPSPRPLRSNEEVARDVLDLYSSPRLPSSLQAGHAA
jgi:glycosyltransferase involved in cell wall biosynthesis